MSRKRNTLKGIPATTDSDPLGIHIYNSTQDNFSYLAPSALLFYVF